MKKQIRKEFEGDLKKQLKQKDVYKRTKFSALPGIEEQKELDDLYQQTFDRKMSLFFSHYEIIEGMWEDLRGGGKCTAIPSKHPGITGNARTHAKTAAALYDASKQANSN